MLKFDVVFLDVVAPYDYEIADIETKPMGATEQHVIRIAEGLASPPYNLRVAVLQNRSLEQSGRAFYLPLKYAGEIDTRTVVHIRGIPNLHLWPRAVNIVWCHDLSTDAMKEWCKPLREVNAELVGVSKWHEQDIKDHSGYEKVGYVYSHYDDKCNIPIEKRPKHDPFQLVWMSSPHKGLKEALPIFDRIRAQSPKTKLLTVNPGYYPTLRLERPGIQVLGSLTRPELRAVVARSLCLFYPTQFKETFGVVACEAEALGTPVATYNVAGLGESVQMSGFCKDEDELVTRVLEWQNSRPVVSASPLFSLQASVKAWYEKLFRG